MLTCFLTFIVKSLLFSALFVQDLTQFLKVVIFNLIDYFYSSLDLILFVLYNKVTQFYTNILFLCCFFIMVYLQEIGYSLLHYTVGPCCLTSLNAIVGIYQYQAPGLSFLLHLPTLATVSVLHVYESVSVLKIDSFVIYYGASHTNDIIWYMFSLDLLYLV